MSTSKAHQRPDPDPTPVRAIFTFLMTEAEIQERAHRLGLRQPEAMELDRIGRRLLAAWTNLPIIEQLYEASDEVLKACLSEA